jgi:hypothetical protein
MVTKKCTAFPTGGLQIAPQKPSKECRIGAGFSSLYKKG